MAELQMLREEDVPAGLTALLDAFTNLHRVADYCESNYVQTVDIHKEKVARREIGILTCDKNTSRSHKIVAPGDPERPARYVRKPVDYGVKVDGQQNVKLGGLSRSNRPTQRPPSPPRAGESILGGSSSSRENSGSGSVAVPIAVPTPSPPFPPPSQLTTHTRSCCTCFRKLAAVPLGNSRGRKVVYFHCKLTEHLLIPSPTFSFLLLEVSPTAGPAGSSSTAPNSSPSPTPSSFSSYSSTTLTPPSAPLPPDSPSKRADPSHQPNAPTNTSPPSNPAPAPAELQSGVSPLLSPVPPPLSSSSSSSPAEGPIAPQFYSMNRPRPRQQTPRAGGSLPYRRPVTPQSHVNGGPCFSRSPDNSPPPPEPPAESQSCPEEPPGSPQPVEEGHGEDNDPYAEEDPPWAPRNHLEKVVAIYDYTADKEDELSFQEGAIIYVMKKNEDGWFEGVMNGATGLFPGNYVESILHYAD